jgi:hypothetical protein
MKERTLSRRTLDPDRTTVLGDDALADRQAQAGTLIFGGKERREKVRPVVSRNPWSIVGKIDREKPTPPC